MSEEKPVRKKRRHPAHRRKKKANIEEILRKEKEKAERDLLRRNILDRIPDSLPDMYPAARSIHRHFILHTGPTNSGKTYEAMEGVLF